jgi:hypothetical protein
MGYVSPQAHLQAYNYSSDYRWSALFSQLYRIFCRHVARITNHRCLCGASLPYQQGVSKAVRNKDVSLVIATSLFAGHMSDKHLTIQLR